MARKTLISIVLLISLSLMAYVLLDIGETVEVTDPVEDKAVAIKEPGNTGISSTEQITTKTHQLPSQIQPVEQVSDEIVSFNEQLVKDLTIDYSDESARINAVDFLQNKQIQGSAYVVEKINKYYENIVDNQIEVSDLILRCKSAKKEITEIEKGLTKSDKIVTERLLSRYYFSQGLLESNICDDLRTTRDPFFVFLESARKGDMLSQLLLTDHLYRALTRKLINPWKYPLEYMDLRDEAITYLKILASKGVSRASARLTHMYSSSSLFMPPDRVLEYYYSFLAEKQERLEGFYHGLYLRDSSKLYYRLTEEQKIIVDRMTENL